MGARGSVPRLRGDDPVSGATWHGESALSVPRLRGDDPGYKLGVRTSARWSVPRLRGDDPVTGAVVSAASATVFPACAGMIRRRTRSMRCDWRVPRPRGDDPIVDRYRLEREMRSPPTRG